MSKFYLKPMVLSVAAALLGACQHMPAPSTTNTTTPLTASVLTASVFDEQTSPSAIAKAQLIQAMSHHLSKERHVVSVSRSQVLPLYVDDSLNKNADPFWGSVTKVSEFQKNHKDITDQPYRTEDEYLQEGMDFTDTAEAMATEAVDLPYLRYNDQNNPQAITRSVAMSDDYKAHDEDILSWVKSGHDGIGVMDEMLDDSPLDLSVEDKKDILKALNQLKKERETSYKTLLKSAKGYQIQDLKDIKACFGDYEMGVRELLQRSSDQISRQSRELLYQNYAVCAAGYWLNRTITPNIYIDQLFTEKHLKTTSELLVHQKQMVNEQRALRALGRTYANAEQAYLDSYLKFAQTAADILGEEIDDTQDLYDAKSALQAVTQYAAYRGVLDEEYTQARKYSGGISGWLQAYRDMKAQKDTDIKADDEPDVGWPMKRFGIYGSMMASMLEYIKQTPEQLRAKNLYQYNNTTITSLSHHNPATHQATMLWSLDFESPTARQSAQLPVQMDFGTGQVTADVSALLPVVAAAAPKYAPLPKDVPNGLVYFKLPHDLSQKIPSTVIYDAIGQGVVLAFKELDSQSFTPVAKDEFATQLNASHVIKLNLSTQQIGEMYATIAKNVAQALNAYVDAHPDIYPDTIAKKHDKNKGIRKGDSVADDIKKAIKDFTTLTQTHRSSDVGGLLQAIEGILPISVDTVSYLYVGADGQLAGVQSRVSIRDELHDYRLNSVAQTRYDKAFFDRHALSGQFYQAFSEPAQVDGVALIKSSVDEHHFQKMAHVARLDYKDDDGADAASDGSDASGELTKVSNICTQNTDRITDAIDDSARQMAEAFKQKECPTRQ